MLQQRKYTRTVHINNDTLCVVNNVIIVIFISICHEAALGSTFATDRRQVSDHQDVELLLESFGMQLEDLRDRIQKLLESRLTPWCSHESYIYRAI